MPNVTLLGAAHQGHASTLSGSGQVTESIDSPTAANICRAWISGPGNARLDVPKSWTARADIFQLRDASLQATSMQCVAPEHQAADAPEFEQAATSHLRPRDCCGGAMRPVSSAPQAHHFCRSLRRVVPRPLVGGCGPMRMTVEAVSRGRWESQDAPPKRMKQRIRSARRTRDAVEADNAARRLLRLNGVNGVERTNEMSMSCGSYAVTPVAPLHGAGFLDLQIWSKTITSWQARLSQAKALQSTESEFAVFEKREDKLWSEGSAGPAATSSTAMPTIADFSSSADASADAVDLELNHVSWLCSNALEPEVALPTAREVGCAADSGEKRWLRSSCSTRVPTSMGLCSEMGSATPDMMRHSSARPQAPPSEPHARRGCYSVRAWSAHLDRRHPVGHVPLPPV